MSRLAESHIKPSGLPTYCSSCFNQDSKARHIDFEAACDRGFYGNNSDVTMDDLILCENCIGEAASQLGWMRTKETMDKLTTLEHRLTEETKRAEKAEGYAERMEEAFKHRPQQLTVSPPRKRGRPRVAVGQED